MLTFFIIISIIINKIYSFEIPLVRPNNLFSDAGIDIKEPEKTLIDCTEALSSWSYFVKTSMMKLLKDQYEKDELNIAFIQSLVPQVEIIDNSFLLCKKELGQYGIEVKDEENKFELQVKQFGNKKMIFKTKNDIEEAENRLEELIKEFKYLNEVKNSILKFSANNVCLECNLFSAQISLISILKKLRIIYDSYIQEINYNIDDKVLKELNSTSKSNLK